MVNYWNFRGPGNGSALAQAPARPVAPEIGFFAGLDLGHGGFAQGSAFTQHYDAYAPVAGRCRVVLEQRFGIGLADHPGDVLDGQSARDQGTPASQRPPGR